MDIRKLQRAIVDGLEDVKAQDIVVFNTEAQTPLFERVIIASGASNRQTKALASSVRETVKSRGMDVLRMEGEENGEWIIVDCGAAVAHIMQPSIREYYRLEELWGAKSVAIKRAARTQGLVKASEPSPAPAARKAAVKAPASRKAEVKALAGRKTAAKSPVQGAARTSSRTAASTATAKPIAKPIAKPTSVKTVGRKSPAKAAASGTAGVPTSTVVVARKTPARKAAPAKKATAPRTAPRKATTAKATSPAAKAPVRKSPASKSPARKSARPAARSTKG